MELLLGHTMSCPLFLFPKSNKRPAVISVVSLEWPSFGFIDCTVSFIPVILRVRVIYLPLLPLDLECLLRNFLAVFLDLSLSIFLVLDCLLVASRISSFSMYSMTSVIDLVNEWKLILIMLFHHWAGTIWFRILIRSPSVTGTFELGPRKYSK